MLWLFGSNDRGIRCRSTQPIMLQIWWWVFFFIILIQFGFIFRVISLSGSRSGMSTNVPLQIFFVSFLEIGRAFGLTVTIEVGMKGDIIAGVAAVDAWMSAIAWVVVSESTIRGTVQGVMSGMHVR